MKNHPLIEARHNDFLSIGSQQHAQSRHTRFKASTLNKLMKLEP